MTQPLTRSLRRTSVVAGTAALAVLATAGIATTARAGARSESAPTQDTLTARTLLHGASLGVTHPDDVTRVGDHLFVAFQNSVPSTGGTTGAASAATQSTIVELTLSGTVEHRWQLTGKCDGLTSDPAHDRVLATVNEDGNSAFNTIALTGSRAVTRFPYDADPLPHGGGTDSITVVQGHIYVAASAPTGDGPAVYEVTLSSGIAHLSGAPFYDSSTATLANEPGGGAATTLALTDPDSSIEVPRSSPRFGGDYELTSQGDQQAVFVSQLGRPRQALQVLNLSQSVNDTAWATSSDGVLVATDAAADTVVLISGPLARGTAYTAVTPGGANTAPANPGPNYLGTIDLHTGLVSPLSVAGASLHPGGLLFVPGPDNAGR